MKYLGINADGENVYGDAAGCREIRRGGITVGRFASSTGFDPKSEFADRRYMTLDEMNPCTAFQVTEDDIENVLRECWPYVGNTQGKTFEAMAEELLGQIDPARVEKAALDSGTNLEEQTAGAIDEIKKILVEQGILDDRALQPQSATSTFKG